MGSNFMDEVECSNLFDLFDFPEDDRFENVGGCADFPVTWDDELPNPNAFLSKNAAAAADDLSAELYVPYEDIVQLEWLSAFVEDSYSGGGAAGKESLCPNKGGQLQAASSPVYVLESSSSSSCCNSTTISTSSVGDTVAALCGPQRARSKRPRPATFSPRPPPSTTVVDPALSRENKEKERRKKEEEEEATGAKETAGEEAPAAVRKCLHCEITKTPQWRAGPRGPKTLCNACGVRYKSGRLFPEYRPAASPTFVASVHSNSHKKVAEMRSKASML